MWTLRERKREITMWKIRERSSSSGGILLLFRIINKFLFARESFCAFWNRNLPSSRLQQRASAYRKQIITFSTSSISEELREYLKCSICFHFHRSNFAKCFAQLFIALSTNITNLINYFAIWVKINSGKKWGESFSLFPTQTLNVEQTTEFQTRNVRSVYEQER